MGKATKSTDEFRMPVGCAFTSVDLFYSFDLEKVQVPRSIRRKYIVKTDRYTDFIAYIFSRMVEYILKDIVETGATFKLPLAGKIKAYIKVDREKDKDFKNFRKAGKWKDLNFLETDFTGPSMNLHFMINGFDRKKIILCDTATVNRMVEKCNQGFLYGDKNLDKTINDYYDVAFKMFPDIPQEVIKEILVYGWRMLYLHRVQGGEINIRIKNFSCYFGIIHKDRSKLLKHYSKVLARKLRITACKKKFLKTKYYYVGFRENQYKEFLETKKIKKEYAYLLYEECIVSNFMSTRIIRIKLPEIRSYKTLLTDYPILDYDLLLTRKSCTFQDLSTTNNNYIILSCEGMKKKHSYLLGNKLNNAKK